MLTVTAAALERLASKLANKKANDGQSLRFKRRRIGWRLQIDRPQPRDVSYIEGGRCVLLLDPDAANALTGMQLDVRRTRLGPRLTLRKV